MYVLFAVAAVAVRCPSIPFWDGKQVNMTGVSEGDTANCSCGHGYMFPQRQAYIHSVCDETGEWSPQVPDCIGKTGSSRPRCPTV